MPKNYPATITEITEAQRHAQAAAENNEHISACPYKAHGPDDEHGRFLQLTWARAFRETQALLRQADHGTTDHSTLDV